jgi:N4-gp56 family major capsid protein
MPDFSTILQAPEIRALVQENILERAFHDALFPRLLFRGEATPQVWPGNVGDTMVFTGTGLIKSKQKPLVPGTDPTPSTYTSEQWTAQIQQYADSVDTHMPTSITAIANLFLRNAQQLGLSAGQTLNRIPRNRMYNAALSGHTVADGTQGAATTLRVKYLNGFTRARRPDLPSGSAVKFETVSANNTLSVLVNGNPGEVVSFSADNPGDEIGPGVLTLAAAHAGVTDRDTVLSLDRTSLVRVGGGLSVDALSSSDLLKLADIRAAVSRFWQQNVPEHPDGRFHCHLDPISQSQVFADPEWQRLLTSLPDYYMYKQFAIGELLGCVYFRNSENPLPETVEGGDTGTFTEDDPFGGELANATSVVVHRPLFVAQGLLYEYYQDLGQLITEAGVTGRVGEPSITNNGIEVMTDRIQLLIRSPLNRLQDLVSTSWKFIGDWPVRTDVTTGDAARFKRVLAIEHGQ